MKKTLLTILSLASLNFASAQCNELFISEYVEGSGNNKALEIYNPTSSPVSLANYRIVRWDNGSLTSDGTVQGVMNLPSNITLNSYQAYVVVVDLQAGNPNNQNQPVDAALVAKADTFLCPDCAPTATGSRVMCFNGDDALSLQKNGVSGWSNVDIFGKIGEDPGTAWTNDAANNYIDVGGSKWLTANKTLIRKTSVLTGVSANPSFFNAQLEYDTLPNNTFSNLGQHACNCQPTSITEAKKSSDIIVYPNPTSKFDNNITIKSSSVIKEVSIFNTIGQIMISSRLNDNLNTHKLSISDLPSGIYLIEVKSSEGESKITKLIKQ